MGRSSSKRKQKIKQQTQVDKPSQARPTRRQFIAGLGALGLGAAIGVPLYHLVTQENNRWKFLDIDPHKTLKKRSYPQIKRDCTLLTDQLALKEGPEYQYMKNKIEPKINKIISDEGLIGEFEIEVKQLYFGAPIGDSSISQSCKEYCKTADAFLHDTLKGLEKEITDWRVVGIDRVKENESNVGYITAGHYGVISADMIDKSNGEVIQNFIEFQSTPEKGGRAQITNENWSILVSADSSAIATPFSEGLPVATWKKAIQPLKISYAKKRIMAETFEEGMSYSLTKQLGNEIGVQNLEEYLNKIRAVHANNPLYRKVPKSVAWIEKNGVQKAFDLYMEDPRKFMRAIGATE